MNKKVRASALSLPTASRQAFGVRAPLVLFLACVRRAFQARAPLVLFFACVLLHGGCTCAPDSPPLPPPGVIACKPQHPTRPTVTPAASAIETVAAGTAPGTFSVTSTGEASFVMRLVTPPGRAGVEPEVALRYSSSGGGGDGVLGVGFSMTSAAAIKPCPSHLSDGEVRDVRYDAKDKLCLAGKPLVPVGSEPGRIEYRVVPDDFTKVIGHDPTEEGTPRWFEVFTPTGLVIDYGTSEGTRPRGPGGVPRAWLATVARNGRGDAMTYGYCFADAAEHTAEYALDEIRYTHAEGSPALEATRAVKFVYGTKDPDDVRTLYSGGMALQSSLRLDAIQMVGPGDVLVRRYAFGYAQSPTTHRTLLTQVEECTGDGVVCKPPTRFQYQNRAAGFKERATSLLTPTALQASPLLLDIDGDGIEDLVVPDTNKALSTPQNPITQWLVAHNGGAGASPAYLAPAALAFSQEWGWVAEPSGPADPALIQPELGTALDYDQNGRGDILLHDVYDLSPTWQVLLAQPDHTFLLHDTGIQRPFPLGVSKALPTLTRKGGSMHLADMDGDSAPDLIQCEDHGTTADGDPSKAVWRVHLWRPSQGAAAAGFDPEGEAIDPLAEIRCDTELHTVDLHSDGKVDLVFKSIRVFGDGTEVAAATYDALTRLSDASWEVFNTKLPTVGPGGRVVFLDVNADGLPDVVQSGFPDHMLRTYLNTGPTFSAAAVMSFGYVGFGDQDAYFRLAVPLDFNGDGQRDLLMPVPGGTLPNHADVLPAWAILQARAGAQGETTFTLVDPHIPFEAVLGDAITLADPHGPRIGDLNGDAASDVVLPLGGVFHIFENLAPDQDLLVGVSDGMNAHEPTDPDFVPNVSIAYGHLIDPSITSGAAADDPALESALYRSHADAMNDCAYPRRCAVGPRRVVSAYTLNDGADGVRRFAVRYRDGRYHHLGRGFLGFGERRVTDLDTLAGTAEFYDNVTFDEDLNVFPFAGQVKRQWRWNPGLPSQPKPDQIELSFLDTTREVVPTHDGKTYFTLPTQARLRREQGVYSSGGAAPTLEAYVRKVESSGGAVVLRDTTAKVIDFDSFGNVRAEAIVTSGVALTMSIERTFKNDTDRWVLGQLQTQKECSTAAMQSQCRTLTRTTTVYGEVETESIATDDGSPETKRTVTYARDAFGNVTGITAEDAYGHHRSSTITYDPEGIFPSSHTNAAGHTSFLEFDARFGVLAKRTDPNGLVTAWTHDGFGRLGLETRPDGTQTTITLSRTQDGGSAKKAWRVTQRTTTSGGADEEVAYDSFGRPVRWWWHGPATPRPSGEPPRLMQTVVYDARSGQVARRSVPVSEGTPEGEVLFEDYEYDALGREVRHTTPWNAVTETSYAGLFVHVTDSLKNVTSTQHDPLGRPVAITDAAKGVTSYTYGPFGLLHTVTDPGTLADPNGALTRMTRDALGRVKKLDDPDRGTTVHVYNGFGELRSSTDALGRVSTFDYDALGRMQSRVDQKGAQVLTTTWTWDTAANGLGKLHTLASPDGVKTYSYNGLGQLEGLALAVSGESETLEGTLDYDAFGRVATITYPTPTGAPPFVVAHDYDPYGHVLTVRDSSTDFPYWHLTDVDNAGRFRNEVFGNEASTERSYFAAKQSLKSILTESGGTAVQKLAYDYDARLNLTSRTDALQPQKPKERFRYDALERLTCTYFSIHENPFAPCAWSYDYEPNGNLTFKSDVGVLSYGDPAHPHAVTAAGGDSFGYDAVGNQFTRPAGVVVSYTPFDLPKTITQGASTVTFGYDGDEKRIRKTTPKEETLYFGDLYERVTPMGAAAKTEHRYSIHSPERIVAVVTRGGEKPGTLYVHVDHLGSVDALTDEDGTVVERRSYDPFGQRRNPVWGQPPPASFSSKTTKGFTGHESDDELGLVNMKGRVFDPKLGRFLTTDPIVSAPLFGQSWNPYSYVLNNPLAYVDPSGFEPGIGVVSQPGFPDVSLPDDLVTPGPLFQWGRYASGGSPPATPLAEPSTPDELLSEAAEVGAAVPPTDVDTTGSGSEYVPQPVTSAPDDWSQNSYVQIEGGFFAGLSLGLVPFAGVGQQLLDAGEVLPPGTQEARTGLAVGQIVGGIVTLAGGVTGEVLGGAATVTGIGAAVGVPAIVVSTTLVVGGAGNIAAGVRALMTTGSGSSGPQSTAPATKETGSYTNTHESGRTYSGKGSRERSQVSGRRIEKATGDKHVATEWTKAPNETEAFKQEAHRIDQAGGSRNPQNYNKIESPGKRFIK